MKIMKNFNDFYKAWNYLNTNKYFWHKDLGEMIYENMFQESLSIDVVKVNSENHLIDEDESQNTKIRVWLESGEPYLDHNLDVRFNSHNTNYDSGGDTFEEAIIEMANLVYNFNKKQKVARGNHD